MGNQYSYYQTEAEEKTQFVFGTDQVEVDKEFDISLKREDPEDTLKTTTTLPVVKEEEESSSSISPEEVKIKSEEKRSEPLRNLEQVYVIEYDKEISYFTPVEDLDDTILDVCVSLRKLHMNELYEGLFDFVISTKEDTIKIQMFKKGFNFINPIDTLLHTVTFTKTNSYFIVSKKGVTK
jgi:hypothetical protein